MYEDIQRFVERVESTLNEVVETGSDDDLFVAGYFHGHFSLAVSQINPAHPEPIAALDAIVKNNLEQAVANAELAPEDPAKVWQLWATLQQ